MHIPIVSNCSHHLWGVDAATLIISSCFFFFLRFYLFIHARHRNRQRHRQREKQAPCREPNVGLDPGSPGSCPGLQAALNHCATGAAPPLPFFKKILFIHESHGERGRDIGRGRSRLMAGSPMQDLILILGIMP